jgi:hypothetical protein
MYFDFLFRLEYRMTLAAIRNTEVEAKAAIITTTKIGDDSSSPFGNNASGTETKTLSQNNESDPHSEA